MSLLTSWFRLGSTPGKTDPCPCPSHDSLAIVEKADILHDEFEVTQSKKVQFLVQTITETHAKLLELPNLRPGNSINQLLGNLVSVCSEIYDRDVVDRVLSHPSIQALLPSLRQICAQAEACLELHWTEHILSGQSARPDDVLARLKTFPYYENYEDLTRLELCAILSTTKNPPKRVAFIGSGPLPLTSLCLLQALKGDALLKGMSAPGKDEQPVVLNVDCDSSAIAASLSLCLALGETGRGMEFICAEATSPEKDLVEFDVVYMAALVGISQAEKEGIILEVVDRMRKGALLVARSSWGLRTCLYPEVDLATGRLLERLEPCVVVHPYGQVVNSVIVAKLQVLFSMLNAQEAWTLGWTKQQADLPAEEASRILLRIHDTAAPWFRRQTLQDVADAFRRWQRNGKPTPLVLHDYLGRKLGIPILSQRKPILLYRTIPNLPADGHDRLLSVAVAYIDPKVDRTQCAEPKVRHRNLLPQLTMTNFKLAATVVKMRQIICEKARDQFAADTGKIVAFGASRTLMEGDEHVEIRTGITEALQIELFNMLRTFLSVRLGMEPGEIPCFIQNVGYLESDAANYPIKGGVRLLDDPLGFLEVDERTIVISLDADVPVRQIIVDIARPAAFICRKLPADKSMDGYHFHQPDPVTPQVRQVLGHEYDEFPLPKWGAEKGLGQMAVYVRKNRVDG
ncbi:hypothetical protein VTI74DRAFT_6368 [Chaetomium olivicolor]